MIFVAGPRTTGSPAVVLIGEAVELATASVGCGAVSLCGEHAAATKAVSATMALSAGLAWGKLP